MDVVGVPLTSGRRIDFRALEKWELRVCSLAILPLLVTYQYSCVARNESSWTTT